MQEFIASIARQIVDNPDDVSVTLQESDDVDRYELAVAQEDLGKIIGRRGRTARAFRLLLAAAATKSERRFELEIVE